MASVDLGGITKKFGAVEVIRDLSLTVADGSFCALLGPSGCGKTTLLRMIAGLEAVTEGCVKIGDREVTHIEPAKRGVAMVFQSYALYPHLTVAENICFSLSLAGETKARQAEAGARPEILPGEKVFRPLLLVRFEEDLEVVRGQERFFAEESEEAVVVLDAVNGVVLGDGAVDEEAVEPRRAGVLVADAHGRAEETRDHPVVNAAEGVDVDGDIVAPGAKFAEEREGFPRAFLDHVFLEDGVDVRVALEQISRAGPEREDIDGGVGKVRAQLVQERRGDERVTDAGQRVDENSHDVLRAAD